MDWLKDKKNQPIVIGVVALVLVGAVVMLYLQMTGGSGGDAAPAPDMSGTTQATMDPSATGAPTSGVDPTTGMPMPAAAPPAATQPAATPAPAPAPGTAVAKIGPMESARPDPFKPVGWKKPAVVRKPVPHIMDLPIPDIERWRPNPVREEVVDERPQPTRRMAGLLLNGRVYAIIETNGSTEVVQPGDTLKDRLAMVDRIERDKVILKTLTSKTPRYLVVRMAAAPRTQTPTAGTTTPTTPGGGFPGPRTPMYPGVPAGGAIPRGI